MDRFIVTAACAALCTGLLPGCIEDGTGRGDTSPADAVKFQTTIAKTTRATGGTWEHGDKIGIYMIPAGTAPGAWSGDLLKADNKSYTTDLGPDSESAQVVFEGVDQENTITWPGGNQTFDFVAYYPYRNDIAEGYIYLIDVSSQNPQREIDLMWSDNVKGQRSGSPTLTFKHKLSKLVFNISDETEDSLEDMEALISGLPTQASFHLPSGKMIEGTEDETKDFAPQIFFNDADPTYAVVEAIVLPGEYDEGYTMTFSFPDGSKATFELTEADYRPGMRYLYDIALTHPEGDPASFVVEGEERQIAEWETGIPGEYPGQIPVTGPEEGADGGPSAPWGPVKLGSGSADFQVEGGTKSGDSYLLRKDDVLIITKDQCQGITSVSIDIEEASGMGEGIVRSVKVGDHDLVFDPLTPDKKDFAIPSGGARRLTFHTVDGKPRSGTMVITVEVSTTMMLTVSGFGTNLE